MSDERDETRPYGSAGRADDTRPNRGAFDDRTRAAGSPFDDRTKAGGAGDDWAPSRANPVWSGRAEVRSPQPGRTGYDTDWAAGPAPTQRDRWWMPIVVGIIVLILLGVLGWSVYVILENSGNATEPTPAPTTNQVTTAATTASAETSEPSSEPTPTTPSTLPSTTDPVTAERTVPALRGLSLAEAQAALTRTGLRARVIYRSSDEAPVGTVIDSDPAEGQEVPPDTRVTLVVAQAPTGTPTTATTTPATDGDDD